ncbi:hypothetical protein NDU88_001231 [Pleurodeles waltl]|uniref:Uncharacterized protein n=1 Tax=Pleurodeles waltl TaxID=8319 RepID=A0AAV7SC13_PLEWA|nr:hypothetical protein NDU88_001231 [Pleurodeles waltl]
MQPRSGREVLSIRVDDVLCRSQMVSGQEVHQQAFANAEEDLQLRGPARSRGFDPWNGVQADPRQLGEPTEAVAAPTHSTLAVGTVSCCETQSALLESSPTSVEQQRRECPCKDEVREAGVYFEPEDPLEHESTSLGCCKSSSAHGYCPARGGKGSPSPKMGREGHSGPPPVLKDPHSFCVEQIPAVRHCCLICLWMQGTGSFCPREIPSCFFGAAEDLLTREDAHLWKCCNYWMEPKKQCCNVR